MPRPRRSSRPDGCTSILAFTAPPASIRRAAACFGTRRDIYCDHFRGPGSSPILVDDLLVFHMDGIDVQFVIALDKKTGKTVWRTNRSTDFGTRDGDFRKAYTTPIVIDFGGRRQLISVAAVEAMSYDPATGKELWKVRHEGYSEAARPLFGFGLVFLNTGSGSQQVWAVRPDGSGDVTASHVVWKFDKNVSRRSSPILVDDLIYMVSDDGIASCVEAKTGKLVWQQRLGGQCSASPLAADGRIYLFSQEGPATVIAPGREYQPVGRQPARRRLYGLARRGRPGDLPPHEDALVSDREVTPVGRHWRLASARRGTTILDTALRGQDISHLIKSIEQFWFSVVTLPRRE